MTRNDDFIGQVESYLDEYEGMTPLPDAVRNAVRAHLPETRQLGRLGGPMRRFDFMNNNIVRVGIAAAVIVLAVIVGINFLPGPNTGSPPEATPSPSPSPSTTAEPTPSPAASPPPLTQSFTSTVHGISVSYPEGWIAQAATEPWTGCLYCTLSLSNPQIDVLYDPVRFDGLMLRIASQPIGESTPEDWVAAQMASWDRCTTTEPIVVDGATGLSGGESCNHAVVTTAGRGYSIDAWVDPNDLDLVAQYDRAWFEEVLATVQLHPEDAIDSGASPSP